MTRDEALTMLAHEAVIECMELESGHTAGYVEGEWWLVSLERLPRPDAVTAFPTLDMLTMAIEGRFDWSGWHLSM